MFGTDNWKLNTLPKTGCDPVAVVGNPFLF